MPRALTDLSWDVQFKILKHMSFRDKSRMHCVSNYFIDILGSLDTGIWGACSVERDLPSSMAFEDLSRWMLNPTRASRHVNHLQSATSNLSLDTIRRSQRIATALFPQLASTFQSNGITLHLELPRGELFFKSVICRDCGMCRPLQNANGALC